MANYIHCYECEFYLPYKEYGYRKGNCALWGAADLRYGSVEACSIFVEKPREKTAAERALIDEYRKEKQEEKKLRGKKNG